MPGSPEAARRAAAGRHATTGGTAMKDDIHPKYIECTVTCGCGAHFTTRSTRPRIAVEICSSCHPFYTGQQKFVDTAGRIEKYMKRFGAKRAPAKASASKED